jgi:DNA-binding LytR/AlgR family response regulator
MVALRYIDRVERTADGTSLIVLRSGSHVDDKELIISRRHLAEARRRLKGV